MQSKECGRKVRLWSLWLPAVMLSSLFSSPSLAQEEEIGDFDIPRCWIEGVPNFTWAMSRNIAGCPAGDSVVVGVTGHPSRLRILVSYFDLGCRPKAVPPESIWVVPTTTSGLKVNFQPAKLVATEDARIIADDSTDVDGKTRITMPSFSGCGKVTLHVYIAGHQIGVDSTFVRTVDTDGNEHVQPADLTSPCDLNYDGTADEVDASIITPHQTQGHWDRQVLFGRPMRRTSLCTSCDPDDPGALGESQTTWSPDGKYLAGSMYVQTSDAWGTYSDCHVIYVPSDAKDGDTITEFTTPAPNVHDYNPCWSPLGYEIAFDRDDQVIYRKGFSGSDLAEHEVIQPLGNSTYPGNATSPAFSPDGKWIAFSMADPAREADPSHPTQDVWVVPVSGDTSRLKRLTTGHQTFFPQWSPDGEWVYFDETADVFPHKIMKVRPNLSSGDPPSDLGDAYVQANSPSNTRQDWSLFGFSPDGEILAAGRGTRDESNPQAIPAPPRELRTLIEGCGDWQQGVSNFPEFQHTSESVNSVSPKYSPDGTRVAFEAQPSGEARAQLWATRRNMSLPPLISSLGGRAIVHATPYRDTTIEAAQALSQTVTASDPEGDPLIYNRYSFTSALVGASGTLSWTPTLSDVGDHSVKFLVS